jgi:proteasome accessory factor B
MRDQLGMPIEYDPGKHGYYYTESVVSFPTITATEGEVLALFVAQKALAQYRGTPFEQPLAGAFEKLAATMEREITVDPGELSDVLSFHHTGIAVTNLEVFREVTEGLRKGRELTIEYRKLNATRPERRCVQPYHLASIDGQWYLFANDLGRKDIRTFVLGRIEKVLEVGKGFEKPEDFSITDRLMGSFGVFSGEGDYTVKIEFDAFAAQLVRERQWHSSQTLRERESGRLELGMRLDSLEEIERWVLSWGSHARVIGPPALRQSVKEALNEMQNAYSEMPKWMAELHEAAHARQPERMMQLMMAMDRGPDHPAQMHFRGLMSRQ